MYNELEMISKIDNTKVRIEIILLFIEEYSGWLQHLRSVGHTWGASGEEWGAYKEIGKVIDHINSLKSLILNEIK